VTESDQTSYYTTGPQDRVVMNEGQIVGFAVSTAVADQIVRAMQEHGRVHVCTICATRRDRYRVGRSLGRTVYRMVGSRPSKQDDLVGIMETRDLGETVTTALNQYHHHQ
jgi:hypothetical protein